MKKEEKVEKLKGILESEAKRTKKEAVELAEAEELKRSQTFTVLSIIGPIMLSFMFICINLDISNLVFWKLLVDIAATLILIVAILILHARVDVARCAVNRIKLSKAYRNKQIDVLEKKNNRLEERQSFFCSVIETIGSTIKEGKKGIEDLAKVFVAAVYYDLSKVAKGDNITINIYELKEERVKMILSSNRRRYCDRDSCNIPVLYKPKEGFDIKDESIQDYFCIRCIRGKAKGYNGRYVLGDWETLVKEFKWDGWNEEEKEDILKNKNRGRCIEVGFRYNQYVGFVLRRDDGTVVFLEIIANDYTVIGESGEVDHIAYGLKETYSPLLNVLWDISDFSEEGV